MSEPATREARRTETSRRFFLEKVGTGWILFTGASVAGLAMTARFFFPNDLFEPPTKFKIGYPDEFVASSAGEVSEKYKTRGIWVIRTLAGFDVLSPTCTHLGCTPNWLATESKFKCPCHGSGFYTSGINFEGPAPRPLERFKVSLAPDGQIEVDKSRKFQQELGQWEDPEAFLKLIFIG
ncbi:MAG: ubiquinol-cytochrome c reductase iron-sulfur subunit [Planctomycetota bacterium]|nr:ubiquinol-cytochrome c reductase iron-sulfur subunit [Planctomycetota bacterium]